MSIPAPTATECLAFDSQMEEWFKTIPDYLRPNMLSTQPRWLRFGQYKMLWRYCNLRIILHRRMFLERALKGLPLWQDAGETTVEMRATMDCCRLCQCNATETINSIGEFFSSKSGNFSRLEGWYGL